MSDPTFRSEFDIEDIRHLFFYWPFYLNQRLATRRLQFGHIVIGFWKNKPAYCYASRLKMCELLKQVLNYTGRLSKKIPRSLIST